MLNIQKKAIMKMEVKYQNKMGNNIRGQVIPNSYNEVYGLLLVLGDEFLNKIQKKILNNIKKNLTFIVENDKKIYNIPKYNLKVSLKLQGVSKEALSIIYYLYYNYWCASDKERNYLQNLIKNNEKKIEKSKIENYGNIDIFSNKNKLEKQEENMLITISEKKWYKEIFTKLLNIFRKR